MASIVFQHVTFAHTSASADVFQNLSLLIDCGWRTGVVGPNGCGKSTLLALVAGRHAPDAGTVEVPIATRAFPGAPPTPAESAQEVVCNSVAPFWRWERTMEQLLDDGGDEALTRYAELHERYVQFGGYGIRARAAREFAAMGLPESLMDRPFGGLSGGEQTRVLILGLFAAPDSYALIDEPTNHLDRRGRQQLMTYLAGKPGFLLVSHDRRFLDGAVDHVLSINRSDVRVNQGNYSQWRRHMDEELMAQRRQRQRIERDVNRLQAAALRTRQHADSREADKYGSGPVDRGFIGHQAARQMKRARSVERRIEAQLEDKRRLLGNAEKSRHLKVETAEGASRQSLRVQNVTVTVPGRVLIRDLSFTVAAGARIAVVGPNGCGKTTLLDVLCGALSAASGLVRRPPGQTLSRAYQQPLWQQGSLAARLADAGLDQTRFRQLLGVMGLAAEAFDRDLNTYSAGQLKKVDLCRSLLEGAELLVWDEPLNWIDVQSREQIEAALLEYRPTLVFVEHDQMFIEHVATGIVDLDGGR